MRHTARYPFRPYQARKRSGPRSPRVFPAWLFAACASIGLVEAQPVTREAGHTLEETLVTGLRSSVRSPSTAGSRLGLSIMETPASVQLIDREAMLLRGDHSTAQAVSRAAGFAPVGMQAFAGSALSARGFSGNASVGQLYDGNRLFVSGGAMSFPVDTWAFERVEVLAGPASVLYGTGTIGGAINYVPRTIRRDSSEHEALFALASWDTRRVGVASSGPLNADTAYRVNAVFNDTDGYVQRNSNRRWTGSAALLRDLSETLTATLMVDGADIKDNGYFGTPLINGELDSRIRRVNYNAEDASTGFRNVWWRALLEWRPNDRLRARNETYYLDTDRNFRNVENYTWRADTGQIERSFNFGTDITQSQLGNRLDLTLDTEFAGRTATVLVGGEVNRIDFESKTVVGGVTLVDLLEPNVGQFFLGDGLTPALATETDQAALFGESTVDLFPGTKVLAGLRVERIRLERSDLRQQRTVDLAFNPVTWRVGIVQTVLDSGSLYAQYVVGNDAGGSLISLPAVGAEALQKGRQIEIGFKQTFLEDRGYWSAAAYRIRRNNLPSRDPFVPEFVQQIGQQSSRGAELTLAVRPVPMLLIEANAAVLEARFDEFTELFGGSLVSRRGNVPVNTPERTANLWADLTLGGGWSVGGGARYVGRRFSNTANELVIPAYTLVDAALRYNWNAAGELALRVRNALDKNWVVQPYNNGRQWALGDPRQIEISVRMTL